MFPFCYYSNGIRVANGICHSCGRTTNMCTSINAVSRSLSIASLPTTQNSVIVDLFPVLRCKVTRLKSLGGSFDAEWSGLVGGSITSSIQWAGAIAFLSSFGATSVFRSQVIVCIITFFAPFEMRTKYACCPVTAIIKDWFSYLCLVNFTCVLSKFSLLLSYQILMSSSVCHRLHWEAKKWTFCSMSMHTQLKSYGSWICTMFTIKSNMAVSIRSLTFFVGAFLLFYSSGVGRFVGERVG